MENIILDVKNLRKHYEKFTLKNVSIELPRGNIMGFIGQNGAGKSTTIKSILNIIPFDTGRIIVNGMDNVKNEIKVKQIIGYVGEYANLYGEVSARQIYKFIKKFYVKWDDAFFFQLVDKFGLELNKKVNDLSRGTRVKFALSLALSHHPELLVLDEPTSGLDPVIRNELLDIILEIVKTEDSSVFFSSHITEDMVKIADYVTYINDGEILLSDSKKNMLRDYTKVEFGQTLPDSLKTRLKYCRDSSCIVTDFAKFKSVCADMDFDGNDFEYKSASLDEILLFLINEKESDTALNN